MPDHVLKAIPSLVFLVEEIEQGKRRDHPLCLEETPNLVALGATLYT